jgi:hypothetical protein
MTGRLDAALAELKRNGSNAGLAGSLPRMIRQRSGSGSTRSAKFYIFSTPAQEPGPLFATSASLGWMQTLVPTFLFSLTRGVHAAFLPRS